MGCNLIQDGQIIETTIHGCEYIYNVAVLGYSIWNLIILLGIFALIGWIVWVSVVSARCQRACKRKKR